MRIQIIRMKKPSCKIFKTKNCVPFGVQYTSSSQFIPANIYQILFILWKSIQLITSIARPYIFVSATRHALVLGCQCSARMLKKDALIMLMHSYL